MNTYIIIYALSTIAVAVLELRSALDLKRIDNAPAFSFVTVALVLLGPVTLLGMFANWIEVTYMRLEGKAQ